MLCNLLPVPYCLKQFNGDFLMMLFITNTKYKEDNIVKYTPVKNISLILKRKNANPNDNELPINF
jgi:hypothetical protein